MLSVAVKDFGVWYCATALRISGRAGVASRLAIQQQLLLLDYCTTVIRPRCYDILILSPVRKPIIPSPHQIPGHDEHGERESMSRRSRVSRFFCL